MFFFLLFYTFILSSLSIIDQIQGLNYVPGVAPQSWLEGDQIELNVNKIISTSVFTSYDYYSLPFCKPQTIDEEQENIGQIMSGDIIQGSLYNIQMKKNSNLNPG